jgi:hypothetical protein
MNEILTLVLAAVKVPASDTSVIITMIGFVLVSVIGMAAFWLIEWEAKHEPYRLKFEHFSDADLAGIVKAPASEVQAQAKRELERRQEMNRNDQGVQRPPETGLAQRYSSEERELARIGQDTG